MSVELAMETSRVISAVCNQAVAKKSAGSSCIENAGAFEKKKIQVISTADESVSSRKDISTVDESINSRYPRSKKKKISFIKEVERKLKRRRIENQQMKQSARNEATSYGYSADGLKLMTSSVTSSSRKIQQLNPVESLFESAVANQPVASNSSTSSRELISCCYASSRCEIQSLEEAGEMKRCIQSQEDSDAIDEPVASNSSIQSRAYLNQLLLINQSQATAVLPVESIFVSAVDQPVASLAYSVDLVPRRKELRKKQSAAVVRSVAQKWKQDKIAFWSAEQVLEAFQREEFSRGYIFEATPIEEVLVVVQLRDDVVDSVARISWNDSVLYSQSADKAKRKEEATSYEEASNRKLLFISRELQCNQQMLLELAIAKRCRLHKLIRQRFAILAH
ncbi:RNA binding protein isoform 1 [Dorcoceras hygrometricum]|uniref:RNA binding protein isoform 1 n=1 Tax=Dorcoceras hygrometricum TaxID=472368 RepID=A0A2Z7DCZ1_9LAMI|nr:RNA binding protein isoform 1 [Dorcoceras hygrometricum]